MLSNQSSQKKILCALAFAPILLIIAMMSRYALDFPMLDQWETVPLLQAWETGTLSLADLTAQHNEHRPLISRLLTLPLALATHWELRWEPWLSFACAVAWFGLVAMRVWGSLADAAGARPMAMLFLSVLMFSAAQWQNFLLGWQFQLMLGVLLSTATLLLLTRAQWTPLVGGLAVACATTSTFTFGNGALLWPIGVLLLAARSDLATSQRWRWSGGWLLAGCICTVLYLWGYRSPPDSAATGAVLSNPLAITGYALAYLGAPLFPYHAWGAVVIGVAGLAAVAAGLQTQTPIPTRAFIAGLALLALGSALLTSLARSAHGLDQAMSSRYATFAILLWIGVVLMVARHGGSALRLLRGRVAVALALALALIGCASLHGAYRWSEHANAYATARPAIYRVEPAPQLRWLYPDEVELLKRAAWLKARGYALYRE